VLAELMLVDARADPELWHIQGGLLANVDRLHGADRSARDRVVGAAGSALLEGRAVAVLVNPPAALADISGG
jgi:hypothetical protein